MKIENINQLIITKFYSINHTLSVTGSSNTRTERSSWAIVYKYDGETSYTNKSKTIFANSSQVALLPKGSTYKWLCTKSGHFYIVEFDCNLESKELYTCKVNNPDIVLNILENILEEKLNLTSLSNLKIFQLLYKLLSILLESNEEKNEMNPKLKIIMPALIYMNTNLKKKISNVDLAKACNISTSYFRRLFTQVFDEAPLQYLIDLRMKKAKELLQSDFSSISDIAKEVGYDDIYHFSKLFKQKNGISPLKYLKQKNENYHRRKMLHN